MDEERQRKQEEVRLTRERIMAEAKAAAEEQQAAKRAGAEAKKEYQRQVELARQTRRELEAQNLAKTVELLRIAAEADEKDRAERKLKVSPLAALEFTPPSIVLQPYPPIHHQGYPPPPLGYSSTSLLSLLVY